jgi:hypothetical protein
MEAGVAEEGLSLAREPSADLAGLRRLPADTLGTAASANSFTRSRQLEEELGGALLAIGAHAHLPFPLTLPLGGPGASTEPSPHERGRRPAAFPTGHRRALACEPDAQAERTPARPRALAASWYYARLPGGRVRALTCPVSAPSRPSGPRRPCPGLVFRAPRPHARANA